MKLRHFYSDTFCTDDRARNQEQLQEIADKIRKNCKVKEIQYSCVIERYTCTIYENEAVGVKYWVKDEFGFITEIDEARSY